MDGQTPGISEGSTWGEAKPVVREKKDHILSPSAIKKFALAVSRVKRAGKFKRVSEEFIIAVQAEFEGKLRQIVNTLDVESVTRTVPADGLRFVTKVARDKAAAKMEELAIAIVHGKVMRHPSVGKTLKD